MPEHTAAQPVLKTEGGEMAAYLARPQGEARAGVLLFQEAFGVTGHIRGLADRLATEGYVVLAPELFHRTAPAGYAGRYDDMAAAMKHLQKLTAPQLEADIRAAHAFLASYPESAGKPVAAIGFCMGGRVAYLAAATVPLAAAVSYYGGGLAALLDRAARIACPMLFFWGGRDRHITAEHRHALSEALTAADKDFVDVVFSQADHAFNNDERPSFNPAAARQAWSLRQAFWAERLTRH